MGDKAERREIALRIARFALVGGLSSLLYLLFAWWLIDLSSPVAGTVVAYLLVVPINFLLQKYFTFRSAAAARAELPRFLFIHGMNTSLSAGIMAVVATWWGLAPIWGMLATVVIVPIIVYLALDAWVFYRR
jgi:putative flippase GtrA